VEPFSHLLLCTNRAIQKKTTTPSKYAMNCTRNFYI
jgi:hypothetical protein